MIRKCKDCTHYRESYFGGYISSYCEVFGSLDMDQKERHPDITGATCPRWAPKDKLNLKGSLDTINKAYTKLTVLVQADGNVLPKDRTEAISALGELINEGDYVSALLEGDIS